MQIVATVAKLFRIVTGRCANSLVKIYGSICVSISRAKGGATQTLDARHKIINM